MSLRRGLVLVGLVLASSSMPVACSGSVVGGDCRFGLLLCNGTCVDPNSDPDNCGACGNVCSEGVCTNGSCGAGTGGSGTGGVATGGRPGRGGSGGSGGAMGGSSGTGGWEGSGEASGSGGRVIDGGSGGVPIDGGSGGVAGDASANGGAGGTAGAGGIAGAGGVAGAGGTAGAGGAGGVAGGGGSGGVVCLPPFDTAQQCGDCFTQCTGATPLCAPGTNGFACVPLCNPPLVNCGGQCVNTDNDENNCGQCNRVCASGICQGGQCVGATAGHIVVFCMDYRSAAPQGSPSEALLGNAIFLGSKNPVRIYAYNEFAPQGVVNAVGATIANVATARGRTHTIAPVSVAADVSLNLSIFDYEVLLVYDQPGAPAGRLANTGTVWASALGSFVAAGGSVVVLAGSGGAGEMDDFLTGASLLPATAQTSVTNQFLYNRAAADAVGLNVLSTFRARNETCTFTTSLVPDSSNVFVITDTPATAGSLGAPVVVHRVVLP
jgi:hypothetical protein